MQRASDMVNRATQTALVTILSAMTIAVFLQVLFRYLLKLPLFWTEEFARYCLVWSSLLGAAVALKNGQHMAVTFVMERLPGKLRRIFSVIALLFITLLLTVILLGGIQLVLVTRAQISPALRLPMAIPYSALPIGAAIMIFHTIAFIFTPPKRRDTPGSIRS